MMNGMTTYWQTIAALQEKLTDQRPLLDTIATKMVEVVIADKPIYLFGTGHSHMLAEEGHFRAGGLANFVPILQSALMLHENSILSGIIERQAGIASPLLKQYNPPSGAMLFIFSNSGVNHVPVEMALEAKKHGLAVVSVSSIDYAKIAPLSAIGKRLDEVADYAIDTKIPAGDAVVEIPNSEWRTGAASTIICSMILNGLVAEVILRLHAQGIQPPIFASQNIEGAAAHNEALIKKWRRHNPHL